METVTIKLKGSERTTEIYPTASTIERFKRAGWDVSAAEKALDAPGDEEEEAEAEE